MAFEDDETSFYDGQPVELYKFIGTLDTWRMTSHQKAVTSGAETFTPQEGLTRNVLKIGTQEDDKLALDIQLPFDHPMVSVYAYQTAPPTLEFELYRAHRNNPADSILMWKGKVLSFSVEGRIATLRVPSVLAFILSGIAPQPRYQAPCNHRLYDTRCQVDPASYTTNANVVSVAGNIVEVNAYPFPNGSCNGGEMILASKGERRMIIGNTGTSLTLTYPFASIAVGDTVQLRQGCDHSFATCKSKFSNGANFGGSPLVPDRNPFTSKL